SPGATDIANGSVVLTLEATGNGACSTETATDNMTLTITAAPTAEAGDDETICEGNALDLSASGTVSATNFSTLSWSTAGDGSFDDNTALEPIYTPGSDDITAGTVDLTLTAEGPGSCADAVSSMTLAISPAPSAFAGDDQAFCDISEIDLSTLDTPPSTANGTIQWTTSSAEGTFNDQTLEAPVYTFGSDDLSNGTVTLTVTVTGDAICGDATDEIIISIGAEPTIKPIADATICAGETLELNAVVNNEIGIEWSTAGDGSFDDNSILDAIYSPGVNDSTNGSVDISLTAFGGGTCSDSTFTFTLNINTIDIQLANLDNTSGCGATDGVIDIDVSSNAAGPLSIIWTGPNGFSSTDEDLADLEAGIYEVQVTDDATGCVVTESYEVEDPVPFTIDLISVENQTECGVDNGFVEIEVNNGTGPFNYYIEDENGVEVDQLDNEADPSYSFNALAPGDYQLFVEEGSCTDFISFSINPVQEITAAVDNSQLANCGNEDGEISVDVTQVVDNNYDVVLFDNADVEIASELNQDGTTNPITFNGLGQGTYTVVVTDLVTNCEFSQGVVVNEAADFSITNIDVVDISDCENPNGSIELTIDNPNGSTLTYTWENQDGEIVNVGGEESFLNITEPGNFDVTITDGTCTIIESNIEITQPAECDYDCEDFRVSPITEAATCLGVDDGKMFFLLRDVNESSPELNFDIKPAGTDDSLYNRFTVANIGQGLIIEIDTTFATGTYTVVASDPNLDCVADTVNINIGTKTTLSATIDIEQPTCTVATGSISANVGGTNDEFEYILYFEGDSLTSNTSGVFADLEEGDYELEFNNQNTNACGLENQTFTIENTALVDASAVDINITNPECGEIFGTISASLNNLPSNYEFILVDGDDEEIARNSTGIFNEVPEGTYVVKFENVVDPGACPIADRGGIVIENDGSFSAVASEVENILCFGDDTGSAVITLEGISTGFYSIDNGQLWTEFTSGNRITGLPAVNNLLISDEPGTSDCELSVAVGIEYLSQPIELDGTIELITQASCTVSEQVGEINVPAVTGGVAPYVFSIDGNVVELDADRNIGGLARNVNQLTITDDTGCSESFDIRSIVSPNEVRAIVTEINPNNNCIDDPEGILVTIDEATIENVPGPYNLILNRVNETVTSEYVLDINTNGSNEFVISQFNIDENVPFIKGARYRWTVRAIDDDQTCSADNFVTINGGAIIPTFAIEASDVACFQESGSIELSNIIADETIPLIIEVYEGNDVDPTETFTLNSIPESRRFVIDQSIYGMMTRGDYIVKLLQQPSNCSSAIESENASVFIDAPVAQLNVELVPEPNLPPGVERERTDMNPMPTTRPDRANGSISIRLVEPTSGANGYSAQIFLLTPLGGNNSSDYVLPSEAIDFDSDRTITFDNLLPGIYEIEYYDSFGCGLDGNRLVFDGEGSSDITVDFDRSPFIPNVFTPNNDGKNDVFRILNLPDNGAELIVTNRTGTIVYRDSNYRSSNLWDGGDNPDGIYFYQLTVDGNVQSGWVEIIRGKR
ncbi:gliding motility-associated C-terminal domain-containing protein, partial [Marivirga sp.]|uniref:T9SS type B sorting domain-containing protein n=1 Tax=Marivirga sp. TaxID=2018662 RepID=UPI003DA75D34